MAVNTNILTSRETYSRHYGDFRGVDFSTDPAMVADNRFAYLHNMYKDYRSGQGQGIETIPGFRRRFCITDSAVMEDHTIYGIHRMDRRGVNGEEECYVLVHAGDRLFPWDNYPATVGVLLTETVTMPENYEPMPIDEGVGDGEVTATYTVTYEAEAQAIVSVTDAAGHALRYTANMTERTLVVEAVKPSGGVLLPGEAAIISYYERVMTDDDEVFAGMNTRRSVSFVFNNRLYILDGTNYLVFDGETVQAVSDTAYVPTTYINIIPSGENADIGTEYEQRNVLQPKFKHTFIADGETVDFYLNEAALESVDEVSVYGTVEVEGVDYTVDLAAGKITFASAPMRPEDAGWPEFSAGVVITASKAVSSVAGVTRPIEGCTVVAIYDNRVFFSGNPDCPSQVFWCSLNSTGYADPSYVGILNRVQDGVTGAPITGMIPVADTLAVLKDTGRYVDGHAGEAQDGAVYFHSPYETGENLCPKTYPSTRGLAGVGCLGSCVNFLDDPVFVSRLGLEGIGQLSVRYERAIEHRSSMVDAKLVNTSLEDAVLEEWGGYLFLLTRGQVFMADSRQQFTHGTGVVQYEWYYLDDIGVYRDQYPAYRYVREEDPSWRGQSVTWCSVCGRDASRCTCGNDAGHLDIPLLVPDGVYDPDDGVVNDLTGAVANPPDESGAEARPVEHVMRWVEVDETEMSVPFHYAVRAVYDPDTGEPGGYAAYVCEELGEMTGGVFDPAVLLKSMGGNLFFGTASGALCSFNFDMRGDEGELPPSAYTFDGRAIACGAAMKSDNCGIPHMTKNTVKKSTVIKAKAFVSSAFSVSVRTNRKPYTKIARINSTVFSFDHIDFEDMSFNMEGESLFSVKEKEKKWVEKQYYLHSDEFMKPFGLFYLSFRYVVAGRFKQ